MTAQQLAALIWDIKDIIRDVYEDPEVENVILPFTLLRRMDCVLHDKKQIIDAELEKVPEQMRPLKLDLLMRQYNLSFYNTSKFTLSKLLATPDEIADNFKIYLEGFTDNVKDILNNFTHEDSEAGDLTERLLWREQRVSYGSCSLHHYPMEPPLLYPLRPRPARQQII